MTSGKLVRIFVPGRSERDGGKAGIRDPSPGHEIWTKRNTICFSEGFRRLDLMPWGRCWGGKTHSKSVRRDHSARNSMKYFRHVPSEAESLAEMTVPPREDESAVQRARKRSRGTQPLRAKNNASLRAVCASNGILKERY